MRLEVGNPEDMRDEEFMREALAEARAAAAQGEVPIGAVVVCDGNIVARAHNRRETDKDPSGHAEFAAMIAASKALDRWRLSGCTVYVTLEPCLMCAGLMVNARIDRCVYGAADPKGGALGTLYDLSDDCRLNHAFEVTAGVLEGECAEVLRSFFAQLRHGGDGAQGGSQDDGCGAPQDERTAQKHGDAPFDSLQTCSSKRISRYRTRPRGGAAHAYAPQVLLAIDSFKGSASSAEVEAWLADGIRAASPDAAVTCLSMADGGEGILDALLAARGGSRRALRVSGPLGADVDACYAMLDGPLGRAEAEETKRGCRSSAQVADDAPTGGDCRPDETVRGAKAAPTRVAIVEMAQAAGISLSSCTHDAALRASTRGVGELMARAVSEGARTLYIGLGGSATTDGGAGMLQALGARLLDAAGRPVRPGLRGLRDIASIDLAPAREALAGIELIALADVDNPLVGPRGAVRTFGPQKGLGVESSEATLVTCDRWMAAYGARLTAARDAFDGTAWQVAEKRRRPRSLAGVPGAGAAGGLGAALLALGARLESGVDALLDLSGFDERLRTADLVVTGEGSIDGQTAAGKVPVGVARRVKVLRPDLPVVAVCGSRAQELGAVYRAGVDVVLPIARGPKALVDAMSPEEMRADLACVGETVSRLLALRG